MSGYRTVVLSDFSGGWNARDAGSQLEDNESPDVMNMTLDERGGLVKRLGLLRLNSSDQIVNTGNVQSLHYSAALNKLIAQVGADLYVSTDGGANWGASIKTFTTSARCHMVDFLGKVVIIHPVDTCFSYDGASVSAAIANSPKGSCITVWSNALWSIGDSTNTSRVTRSDLGAITWPASPVTNDLRAKDDKPLTAIGGGQGMDTLGRSGLYAFKEDSCYRIYDVATGAYTVVDYSYGASGPMCVTTNLGITCAISRKGVLKLEGEGNPQLVSLRIDPLFRPAQLTYANTSTMVAENWQERMIFSIPWDGSSVNNLTLEFHPVDGWFVPHSFGLSAATSYEPSTTRKLIGGKVGTGASTYGYVLDVFSGGNDDGSAISCRYQTKWLDLSASGASRFRRLVVNGLGSFQLYAKRNYDTGQGERYDIDIQGEGMLWGTGVWGVDSWGTNLQQDYVPIYSLGVGRSISFEIQETSSLTRSYQNLLDDGAAPVKGGIALYGLSLDYVTLNRS